MEKVVPDLGDRASRYLANVVYIGLKLTHPDSARVLIGWELGGGSGHIQRIVPLARSFLDAGWSVDLAVRDLKRTHMLCSSLLSYDKFSLFQAPLFRHERRPAPADPSLAAILESIGFGEPELVKPVVASWRTLLATRRPWVVISDISPSLNIAARKCVPLIVVGNGWTVPPVAVLATDANPRASEASHRASQKIANVMSEIAPYAGIVDVTSILRGDANFVCTPKELDPYSTVRDDSLYWPVEIPAASLGRTREKDRGVIYLPAHHPGIKSVNSAAGLSRVRFHAYLGGDGSTFGNMVVSKDPIDFARELVTAGCSVHHGGMGTAAWCLFNRVPQLICPGDLEKSLIARAVAAHGSGGLFPYSIEPTVLARAIDRSVAVRCPPADLSKIATKSGKETIGLIIATAKSLMSCPN